MLVLFTYNDRAVVMSSDQKSITSLDRCCNNCLDAMMTGWNAFSAGCRSFKAFSPSLSLHWLTSLGNSRRPGPAGEYLMPQDRRGDHKRLIKGWRTKLHVTCQRETRPSRQPAPYVYRHRAKCHRWKSAAGRPLTSRPMTQVADNRVGESTVVRITSADSRADIGPYDARQREGCPPRIGVNCTGWLRNQQQQY